MKHKREPDSRRDLSIWKLMHDGSPEKQQQFLSELYSELCQVDFTNFKDSPEYVSPKLPYIRRLAFWVGKYENGDFERLYENNRTLAYELLYKAIQFQQPGRLVPEASQNARNYRDQLENGAL